MICSETVYGETPHGGVKMTSFYADEYWNPCDKEEAINMEIVEFDENNHMVSSVLARTVLYESKMNEIHTAMNTKAAIFGISRLRMGLDGPGITTLVTFMGCPLHCKYCLNDICHKPAYKKDGVTPRKGVELLSPQELYERVKIDNLYFQVSGGGICFGGGEPALQYLFIKAFRLICDKGWKISLETSLHYSEEIIRELAKVVDNWIVDIKSLEPTVFKAYTGEEAAPLHDRLITLKKVVGADKVTIKIPLIPGFNDEDSVEWTKERIQAMGFNNIELVKYLKNI